MPQELTARDGLFETSQAPRRPAAHWRCPHSKRHRIPKITTRRATRRQARRQGDTCYAVDHFIDIRPADQGAAQCGGLARRSKEDAQGYPRSLRDKG